MKDTIYREDAIKAVLGITMYENRVPIGTVIYNIKSLPSAVIGENENEHIETRNDGNTVEPYLEEYEG